MVSAATDDKKTCKRLHISHLRLQQMAASAPRLPLEARRAARPRQNPFRGFLTRVGVGHGRKMEKRKWLGTVILCVPHYLEFTRTWGIFYPIIWGIFFATKWALFYLPYKMPSSLYIYSFFFSGRLICANWTNNNHLILELRRLWQSLVSALGTALNRFNPVNLIISVWMGCK